MAGLVANCRKVSVSTGQVNIFLCDIVQAHCYAYT